MASTRSKHSAEPRASVKERTPKPDVRLATVSDIVNGLFLEYVRPEAVAPAAVDGRPDDCSPRARGSVPRAGEGPPRQVPRGPGAQPPVLAQRQ